MNAPHFRIATRLLSAGGLLGTSLVGISAGQAQEYPGVYAQIGAGANFLQDLKATGSNGNTTASSLNFDAGPAVVGSVGYVFGRGLRAEAEFGYRSSPTKNVTLGNGGTTAGNFSGDVYAYTYMANLIYDIPIVPRWQAHIGGGIGAVNLSGNIGGSQTVFGGQAIAGVDYALTPQLRLGLDYRFIGTTSVKSNPGPNGNTASSNYYDHSILVTMRWNFGAPPPPPAVAPPPPPPPPMTQAPPPNFTVYFATNSSTLTPEAREVLRQAAAAATQARVTRISVTGHTDTVGSGPYNQRLSERRAASVRDELVHDGVPAGEIAASGVGEGDLAVATANGINEPRNRRVQIMPQAPGM